MLVRIENLITLRASPKFSWKQLGEIPGHRQVTEFLQSEKDTFVYRGNYLTPFQNIREAVEWVNRFAGVRMSDFYSFTAIARKTGEHVEVVLQKGREFYEKERKEFFERMDECEKLRARLTIFPLMFAKVEALKRPLESYWKVKPAGPATPGFKLTRRLHR